MTIVKKFSAGSERFPALSVRVTLQVCFVFSLSRPTLFGESLILLFLNVSVNSYNSATFEDPSVAEIVENIFKKK